MRRAGERPFLDAEEHHPKPAPETRNLRRQGARDGEYRGEARAVIHGTFREVMPVDMGTQHDPFVGRAGIVIKKGLGLGRPLLGFDGDGHGRKACRATGEPRRRLGCDTECRNALAALATR